MINRLIAKIFASDTFDRMILYKRLSRHQQNQIEALRGEIEILRSEVRRANQAIELLTLQLAISEKRNNLVFSIDNE